MRRFLANEAIFFYDELQQVVHKKFGLFYFLFATVKVFARLRKSFMRGKKWGDDIRVYIKIVDDVCFGVLERTLYLRIAY